MKSVIKNNVWNFVNDKRKIFICIVFAFFCGSELGIAKDANMSICEYVLFVIGDHYYVIYFMFMAYVFFQFDSIRKERSLITVRMEKISRMYMSQLVSVLIQTLIYVICHMIIALAVGGLNLKWNNEFQTVRVDGYYNDTMEYLLGYTNYFDRPMTAFVVNALFMTMGLTLIGMLVYILKTLAGSKFTLVFIGGIILDIMLGFKLGIRGLLEIFFLNHYFLLHHVLFMSGYVYAIVNIGIEVVVITGAYFLIKRIKGNNETKVNYGDRMLGDAYKFSMIFILLYVLLNLFSVVQSEGKVNSMDIILCNIIGYSSDNPDLMEFTKYILFYMVPLFFVGKFIEKEKNLYNEQVAIRYENKYHWQRLLRETINKYIFTYVGFFEIVILLLAALKYHPDGISSDYVSAFIGYVGINEKRLIYIVLLSCILKAFEMYYYTNILILLNDITDNSIGAYIATFLGFIVPFLLPSNMLVSYGCSSVYSLADSVVENETVWMCIGTVVILALKILVMKGIYFIRRKKEIWEL